MPSSAMNSRTPQCVVLFSRLFSTWKSMGYSMCSWAAKKQKEKKRGGTAVKSVG